MQYDKALLTSWTDLNLQLLDHKLFDALLQQASQISRKRCAHNLHQSLTENAQRVVIAMLPGSYVQPHLHQAPQPYELCIVLQGSVDMLLFAANGELTERLTLAAGSSQSAVELAAGQYHSLIAAEPGAVFIEIKQGPFEPAAPRYFADWAPAEQDASASDFYQWMVSAQPGESFSQSHQKSEL